MRVRHVIRPSPDRRVTRRVSPTPACTSSTSARRIGLTHAPLGGDRPVSCTARATIRAPRVRGRSPTAPGRRDARCTARGSPLPCRRACERTCETAGRDARTRGGPTTRPTRAPLHARTADPRRRGRLRQAPARGGPRAGPRHCPAWRAPPSRAGPRRSAGPRSRSQPPGSACQRPGPIGRTPSRRTAPPRGPGARRPRRHAAPD